jgi:hypothetical protein
LIGHDKWIEALEKNNPKKMKELENIRYKAMDKENPNYEEISQAYKQGLIELTEKVFI